MLRLFLPSSCSLHFVACDLVLTRLFHQVTSNLQGTGLFLLKFSWEMFQCWKDMSSPTIAHSRADTEGTPTFHSHLKMSLPQGMEK